MNQHIIGWAFQFSLLAASPANSAPASIDVQYVDHHPVIDGKLDQAFEHLPFNDFNHYYDFGDPVDKAPKVQYKLAYNDQYFYLYIETDANKVTYNKRGYLYGDGFKVILGRLSEQAETDEYYDLSYSPNRTENKQDNQIIGTYNTKHVSRKLSQHSKFQELAQSASTGFEAIIAWDDVHPINPLFDADIGLNIYFAKNISSVDTVGYSISKDESIWDEEVLSRNLFPVNFMPASSHLKTAQIFKRNYSLNENITFNTLGLESSDRVVATINDEKGEQVIQHQLSFKPSSTKMHEHSINAKPLKTGLYTVQVSINNEPAATQAITIINPVQFKAIKRKLNSEANENNRSAKSTLLFLVNHAQNTRQNLKPYELATDYMQQWQYVSQLLDTYLQGTNPLAANMGPYRRAFQSEIDGTYQPYSIKLPANYDSNKKYPLLVFLHGSGQDEQRLLNQARGDGQFIELAPLGRDMFRAYAMPDSQLDIVEAIKDVKKNFAVDAKHTVIGGFSMGGYGALRTYYENPDLYQGVAVFAGHPDLANQWGVEGTHPNFLLPKFTQKFKNVPVFIYHGTDDEALKFSSAQQLKSALLDAGADVTVSFVEGRGHTYQDEQTNQIYHQWLQQFINKDL